MNNSELQLEQIYETVCGENGMSRYLHYELIDRLNEMYDCYEWMCEYGDEIQMHNDLKELRGV